MTRPPEAEGPTSDEWMAEGEDLEFDYGDPAGTPAFGAPGPAGWSPSCPRASSGVPAPQSGASAPGPAGLQGPYGSLGPSGAPGPYGTPNASGAPAPELAGQPYDVLLAGTVDGTARVVAAVPAS